MTTYPSVTAWTETTKEGAEALRLSWQRHAARRAALLDATLTAAGITPGTGTNSAPLPPQEDRTPRTLTRAQVTPLDAARARTARRARAYRAATWTPPTASQVRTRDAATTRAAWTTPARPGWTAPSAVTTSHGRARD